MRLLRSATLVLFVLVCAAAVFFNLKTKPDTSKPTIVCSVKEIQAKCSVNDDELLKYVAASDEKDGDLTKKIFVENVTPFITEGVSTVSFCVEDSDGNIARKSVRLVYTDYEKPELVLKNDLVFPLGGNIDITDAAVVTDKFDGDITGRLYTILESEKDGSSSSVLFKVTNSKGYTYEWRFKTVSLPADEIGQPYKISLKNNYLYLSAGEKKPDFQKLVEGVYLNSKPFSDGRVVVDSSGFSLEKEGEQNVWFRLYTGRGKNRRLLASERLIVVCGGDEQ